MKRHPQEQIIYELMDSPEEMEAALKELVGGGIALEDISLLMSEDVHDRDFKALTRTRAKEGVAAGSVIGGTLGGILGGVVSLGAAITGFGLVVVGPMLALAAAGGLVGGFAGYGMENEEAHRLREAIHAGQSLIAVHVGDPEHIAIAKKVFAGHAAEALEITA